MSVRLLNREGDISRYDAWVKMHPQGTLWQSIERKRYLEALGKEVRLYASEEGNDIAASALVMIDRTAFGLATWDIPRGPLWASQKGESRVRKGAGELMERIVQDARRERCLALFLSPLTTPHSPLPTPHSPLPTRHSPRSIHAEATRIIDLTQPEEAILAGMKPKGRYNIKVARKNGVSVELSDDVEAFHALMRDTAKRDGFTPLSRENYAAFLSSLPGSFLLLARMSEEWGAGSGEREAREGQAIAGLMGVTWNGQGIYYYGASSYAHRNLMAPYLLQWEAMRHCKAQGCTSYDLLGIAPKDAPKNHAWHGISAFKEKFGGEIVHYPPERMILLRPVLWKMLEMKRAMGL